jgi:hypothetical protein
MTPSSAIKLPFHIADPLGIPRPVSQVNFFGVTLERIFRNQFPVPIGCLEDFDHGLYRPYIETVGKALKAKDSAWGAPTWADDPPRYCFLRKGVPEEIPPELWLRLPKPPTVAIRTVLKHLAEKRSLQHSIQLLDLLSMITEDLGPKTFKKLTRGHSWVHDVLR